MYLTIGFRMHKGLSPLPSYGADTNETASSFILPKLVIFYVTEKNLLSVLLGTYTSDTSSE
jgi:hypothetical protein